MKKRIIKLLLIPLNVFLLFQFLGCKVSEPAVEYREIVRDSIIYITDTISVQIPYEVVRETIPVIDTSIIKTSYATSVAYIDTTNRSLFHSLEQKGNIDVPIDTLIMYKDREIEREVIKEVEKEVPFIPIIFYITFVFSIVIVVIYVVKLTH